MKKESTVDFGFEQVPVHEKVDRVKSVFHSVAKQYDLMNDLMSLGIHRLWKRYAIELCGIRPGQSILDVASGTADLAILAADRLRGEGQLILSDINDSMLSLGRDRMVNAGTDIAAYAQADAEQLPFNDEQFDCITIGFGLRNVTNKAAALKTFWRLLKPGGRLVVLEFSKPASDWLATLYDQYSFKLLPKLGQLIAGDADSYQYLVESIRRHPDQETLKELIESVGFDTCEYHNLTGGIVAVHRAYKY